MAIPRLDPAAQPFNLSITVGVELRPYFEIWYNRTKLPGESPAQFAIRKLKEQAIYDYLEATAPTERDTIEQSRVAQIEALAADVEALKGEL